MRRWAEPLRFAVFVEGSTFRPKSAGLVRRFVDAAVRSMRMEKRRHRRLLPDGQIGAWQWQSRRAAPASAAVRKALNGRARGAVCARCSQRTNAAPSFYRNRYSVIGGEYRWATARRYSLRALTIARPARHRGRARGAVDRETRKAVGDRAGRSYRSASKMWSIVVAHRQPVMDRVP